MIKVCHMTSAHAPEDDRIFLKECVSLARAGYDTYLVEMGDSYDKHGVHIVGAGTPPDRRVKRMTSFSKQVYQKALSLDADLYHIHDPELLPYALKLKHKGKKVIFDSHEKYTEQFREKPYLPKWVGAALSNCYGFYERHVLKKIDAVIFPCTMKGRNPFEGQCRRAEIIGNMAILGEFYNLYNPHKEKKHNQICYVGGLTEARGITNDIKAAKQAGCTLALGGTFSPEEYGDAVRQMPEYDCVDYKGQLDRREVMDLLSQSCVGLCTLMDIGQYLKIDTFGVKVYEYMSMGLPVILSKSAYNEKMVQKYKFGICVNPNSPAEIASAIREILDHPDQARIMGENGRKAILEEFNWGYEEKKLLALYEDILK